MTPDVPGVTPTVVVGGGPAGALAALLLARRGRSIRLLERTTEAGVKVCGEFLSPEAVQRLDRVGFPWARAEAVSLTRVVLMAAGRQVEVALPFEARSVARAKLDGWLLEEAGRAGAHIERGVTVRDIALTRPGFQLRTNQGDLHTNGLVLATGKHALSAFNPRAGTGDETLVGYKMDFSRLSPRVRATLDHTMGLFFFEGGYGGIARTGNDAATVSLLVRAHVGRRFGLRDLSLLEALAPELPLLSLLLDDATAEWARPATVANLPYGHCAPARPLAPGLLAVGDQFAVLPSFTGTGISFALASGALAARCLYEAPEPAVAAERHAAFARPLARAVQRRAMLLHSAFQKPLFAAVALRALAHAPRLAVWVARATRLPAPVAATGQEAWV